MKIKIVLDPGAAMPSRAHETDAGLDLYSRERAVIYAGESHFFDTGVHVEIPPGYVGFIKAKSGLNKNYGVTCTGVVDSGYTGSVGVNLINNGKKHVIIKGNQKIAQLVILPIELPELELVESLEDTERGSGGFGSTGEF